MSNDSGFHAPSPNPRRNTGLFQLALLLVCAVVLAKLFHGVRPQYDVVGGLLLGMSWLAAAVSIAMALREAARHRCQHSMHFVSTLVVAHALLYHWINLDFGGAPGPVAAVAWLALAGSGISATRQFLGHQPASE